VVSHLVSLTSGHRADAAELGDNIRPIGLYCAPEHQSYTDIIKGEKAKAGGRVYLETNRRSGGDRQPKSRCSGDGNDRGTRSGEGDDVAVTNLRAPVGVAMSSRHLSAS